MGDSESTRQWLLTLLIGCDIMEINGISQLAEGDC